MNEVVYSEPENKPLNLNELFGESERYEYNKVLGQGAYGIVW